MNIKAASWIGFIAARYVSRGRRNSPATVFSVLGIATGVLALIVIIAVMNGFQMGFIESILEISSGHLRVENFPAAEAGEDLQNRIRALPGVLSAVPFRETNVLMRGRLASSRGAVLRGLPPDALENDLTLAAKLEIEDGYFDLDYPNGIVLGAELARYLSVKAGDQVTILSISGGFSSFSDEEGGSLQYTVTGIFRCGYYEYDLGWAYINIDKAAELAPEGNKPILEIKLKDRWQDRRSMDSINGLLERTTPWGGEEIPVVVSWRDYNRAFFGALRTEKLMMFILVGLIFIVVGLNIFQAQRRTVLEKREEIGLLRALGASELAVRLIFVWDGLIIGFAGAGLGLVLGLFVAFHIPAFFTFLETLVNLFIGAANGIASLLGNDPSGSGEFSVFSPQVFYIKEIPSRIVPHEVILIFFFGFLSALVAAWFASLKASRTRPAEVLRYE
ncbi:ABC transporter permease [Leadbettera azotonutricia]|uniref:Releasing system transmembrane n=1 Tax=Leadbettera azotonutricia (strain ATCC BAA-888 / DSM 13862 / ZAS-9) TaxID=545695 RepID=F5YG64_LEAAZ|nr:ABC transporter permease [Leadbettera azotonutricia]AEF81287.1 releasing system transmembrane [Leadbettera azotonutricia ZAS-9]